ncbi:unnamed protein product, partial [Effrenium voratum]
EASPGRPWCEALVREMAGAVLEQVLEQNLEGVCPHCGGQTLEGRCRQCGEVFPAMAPGAMKGAPEPSTDAKLGALLRSGSWREILERLVWLHQQQPKLGDQISLTLAALLPRLNTMR